MTALQLGQYLREARERAGLSLEQLAERTRVRLENLAALEREDLEELPADAYVRGFVKIVCRELRLPAEEGLALYAKLRANTVLPDEIVWSEESTVKEPGALDKALQDPDRVISVAKQAKKWAIPLGAIVIIVVVALVVRGAGVGAEEDLSVDDARAGLAPRTEEPRRDPPQQVNERRSTPAPGSMAKAEDLEKAEKLLAELRKPVSDRKVVPVESPEPETPSIRVTRPAAPEASDPETELESTRADEVASPPESAPTDAIALGEGAANESPGTSPDGASESPADSAGESTIAVVDAAPVAPGEPLVLEIQAIREAEVTLLLDGGGLPRKRSLITGERKSWKADSLFVISASDAGAIRIILNGADLGSPGAPGTQLTNHIVRR
jgi:cytoskeletal protein RodZ